MRMLENQTALVSGALGGIGQAIALELGSRGAKLALSDLGDLPKAEPLLGRLREQGVRAEYQVVDVTQASDVQGWIDSVESVLGTPSLIVPCAAVVTRRGLRELTSADWQKEMQINLNGVFHVAQAAALRLLSRGMPGRIVFLGSWVAERPVPRITAYCVGKSALRMLAKCMALDLAPHGILVNEVAAGYVDAGLTGETFRTQPERRKVLMEQTPLRKLIDPAEVACQVANLCDPKNSNITGSVVLIDGGLSLLTP